MRRKNPSHMFSLNLGCLHTNKKKISSGLVWTNLYIYLTVFGLHPTRLWELPYVQYPANQVRVGGNAIWIPLTQNRFFFFFFEQFQIVSYRSSFVSYDSLFFERTNCFIWFTKIEREEKKMSTTLRWMKMTHLVSNWERLDFLYGFLAVHFSCPTSLITIKWKRILLKATVWDGSQFSFYVWDNLQFPPLIYETNQFLFLYLGS